MMLIQDDRRTPIALSPRGPLVTVERPEGAADPEEPAEKMNRIEVLGVDSCKQGWAAVRIVDGAWTDGGVESTISKTVERFPQVRIIAVDMPIGLPSTGQRRTDFAARKVLGGRRNSVFLTPPRSVFEAENYPEALGIARSFGISISKQMYALKVKILEVNACALHDKRIFEVHPEVSFWCMNKKSPLKYPKKTWNGLFERINLLRNKGFEMPSEIAALSYVAPDDVVDAVAAGWSAYRIASGNAQKLPDDQEEPSPEDPGVIWY